MPRETVPLVGKPFSFEIKLIVSPEILALIFVLEMSMLPSVNVSKVAPFVTLAGILKLILSKS